MGQIFFPAEWYPQGAIQLTWPHNKSDWDYMIEEVSDYYIGLAKEILKYQKLIVVCRNEALIKYLLGDHPNLVCSEIVTNDTWARDHSGISVFVDDKPVLLDFCFNGWGLKFAACADNQITRELFEQGVFGKNVILSNNNDFVLEGGAIESDGQGTILTTTHCLTAINRNDKLNQIEIEDYLKSTFGANRILWLDHGYLRGDDTDSHVDTLARFCDESTIAYVKCDDEKDEHYEELKKMEEQLQSFVDYQGNPYKLIALPMADIVLEDGERLPATYANFLIMNEVVLMPTYGSAEKDILAQQQLEKAFPTRKVIGIKSTTLIKQHGSLHCVTMQYPQEFFDK